MTEEEWRATIVAEALTWKLTPYHHMGTIKGVGTDCAQFVLRVYVNVGLIEDFETPSYPQDWHIHRDIERYLTVVLGFGGEIAVEDAKPGDLILFKIGRVYSHGAIVVDGHQVIHAHIGARCVTLGNLDQDPDLQVDKRAFSFWGIPDGG